jgi:GDP-mannose 6-dehydrogenase
VSVGCLAQNGHTVTGVDVNPAKVEMVNKGLPTIIEEKISDIFTEQQREGRISATTNGVEAVKRTEVSFICVGTPSGRNGHTDTTHVMKVAEEIGAGIGQKSDFHVIAIRSTVPPGTNQKVAAIIERVSGKKKGQDFAVVSNPEFMREGTAVKDFYEPPLTLIGTNNPRAAEKMREVYRDIKGPIVVSDIGVAEMIKYVNNTFHALKITFANEIGNICKSLGIDSHKVMEAFCMDTKLNLSPYYLKPGFAYGGSCLPKDLKALRTMARDLYVDCPVIENIERSNELQKSVVLETILSFGKRNIGFLGLAFKAGTDDLRNSPIVDIIEQLLGKGFNVKIYDRNVHLAQLIGANKEYISSKIPYISNFITDNSDELVKTSDVIVVVNKDNEYVGMLSTLEGGKVVYDLVNLEFRNREPMNAYQGISW